MTLASTVSFARLINTPPTTPQNKNQNLPFRLQAAQYLSSTGALTATAAIIYGIAVNLFPFIVMGAIFLTTSLTSFYLIHQLTDLKTIDEATAELKTLTANLSEKDAQIERLTSQIRSIADQFAVQNKNYVQLSDAENSAQKSFNQQLQRSAELLAKTQIDAQKEMELLKKSLTDQIHEYKKLSEKDQKTISELNLIVAKSKEQNLSLNTSLIDLQKQISAYQRQIENYARLNTQLQEQIKTISKAMQSPDIDISAINAHATKMQDAIAKQKAVAEKTAKTAVQINAMLDALNRRLPNPKSSQTVER
jgi:chromosome segregation ATPase